MLVALLDSWDSCSCPNYCLIALSFAGSGSWSTVAAFCHGKRSFLDCVGFGLWFGRQPSALDSENLVHLIARS